MCPHYLLTPSCFLPSATTAVQLLRVLDVCCRDVVHDVRREKRSNATVQAFYRYTSIAHVPRSHKPAQTLTQHAFACSPHAIEHVVHSSRIHLHHTQHPESFFPPQFGHTRALIHAAAYLSASQREMFFCDAAVEIKRAVFQGCLERPRGQPDDRVSSLLTAAQRRFKFGSKTWHGGGDSRSIGPACTSVSVSEDGGSFGAPHDGTDRDAWRRN